MTEIPLIEITWNPSEGAIDFGVKANTDKLIVKNDKDIIRMLRHLADCLERRQYPFGNMDDDPEQTRQLMLDVVRKYKAERARS
jgi:hypothetical protein